MSKIIAVAGKGGTGKTTFCGLLINYLCKNGGAPILAVDADANANLNEVLGVDIQVTLGEIREEIATSEPDDNGPIPAGISKQEYMDYRWGAALSEEDDFDLLVMGRTQGKGCYCFINDLLETQISKYSGKYKHVIVDNEAGMEHISRGVLPEAHAVVLVSDCSRRGVQAAGRISELASEIGLKPKLLGLVINCAPEAGPSKTVLDEIKSLKLNLIGVIPRDPLIYDFDSEGKPTSKLPENSIARQAISEIVKKLLEV